MQNLTNFAKAMIVMLLVGIVSIFSWKLGLFGGSGGGSGPDEEQYVTVVDPETGEETVEINPEYEPPSNPSARTGALGTPGNPFRMSIVSFHGYAPALVSNGASLRTLPDSNFADLGLSVEFIVQDDIPSLATLFGSGEAHCAWRTVDFWAQEHPGLRASGYDAQMVAVVDNTRGADAIVAGPGTGSSSVEDLVGADIALVPYTPSHWLLEYAIENSSMNGRDKRRLRDSLIFANGGTPEVRTMLEAGQIQAAVLWEPDLSLALNGISGSRVIFSTEIATSLIYDGIVCNREVIDDHPEVVQAFVQGWLEGVDDANENPELATEALIATEDFFAQLAVEEGRDFVTSLYEGIRWTSLSDNLRFIDEGDFARIYSEASATWRRNGGVADPNSPIISPREAFNTRFVEAMRTEEAVLAASTPEFEFTETERAEVMEVSQPVITQQVTINFDVGSSELDSNAEQILDLTVVPLVQTVGSAYISVEGNTDATGRRTTNIRLSEQRAQAVVRYLVDEWGFPEERFQVVGHGPDNPVCTDDTDECHETNRRTDIAVRSR